ncbi:MAG: LysM peptidoglycan-binding domain-containing protein [Bifidobacteriaceae bacterium]|nr:LysM peptidoglycan-binding domain-containing protein [Bifidobacteriaceae bacterium]
MATVVVGPAIGRGAMAYGTMRPGVSGRGMIRRSAAVRQAGSRGAASATGGAAALGYGGRLTVRGWVVLALVLAGLLIGVYRAGGAAGAPLYVPTESVVVQGGDTLWSIAENRAGGRDVRDVVSEIQRINGLRGTGLNPGDTLEVPRR